MVDIPIEADVSSASRSFAEAGKAAEQSAKVSAKAIERMADSYTKAATAADRFHAGVRKAAQEESRRQREGQEMVRRMVAAANARHDAIDGGAIDRRTSGANLARGFRDSRINALNARFDARADAGKLPDVAGHVAGAVGDLISRFGAITSAVAAAAMAVNALTSAASISAQVQRERGENSRSFGDRVKARGQAAATLGLSEDQVKEFSKAGGKMTVSEQEGMLQSMASSQAAKPFGAPRLGPGEIMGLLKRAQTTGIDLSSVVANPAAAPGNSNVLADMEVARRGGSYKSFTNGGPNVDTSYNKATPAQSDAEMRLQSLESGIADGPLKKSYSDGIFERFGTDFRNARSNSGFLGKVLNAGDAVADFVPGNLANTGREAASNDPVLYGILHGINKQNATLIKPPKPTVMRDK